MNIVRVDVATFITSGRFGPFGVGTNWSAVVAQLGEPPLFEPARDSRPAFARYGNLDFTIENDQISVISLRLDHSESELPSSVQLARAEILQLEIEQMKRFLDDCGITWERLEVMCDDWIDYFQTSMGIHLSFGRGRLGIIAAAAASR